MAEKKIEIKIAATGAQQAAAEIDKVGKAVEEIPDSTGAAANGVEELSAELDQMRKRAEALKEETEDFGEELEKTNDRIRLGRAGMVGLGLGGAVVSKIFREMAEGLNSLDVDKLRQMDAAMAEQVETAKGWAEVLTDPINGIQRLLSGNTIGEAFGDINEQLSRNAEMQAEAVNRMAQAGRATAAELKAVAREIAAANAILDAKAAADAAVRDAADAAAVRGGKAPEDVKAERAAFDRDQQLETINRGLEPKAAETQALYDDAAKAAGNAQRVAANPDATKAQIDAANKAAEEAKAAFEAAKKEYDTSRAVAEEKRRGVNAEYAGAVADAAGDKSQRLAREKQKADEQAAREKAKADREKAKADSDAQRAAAGRTRGEAAAGRDAVGLIPKNASAKLRAAIEAAAAGLQDGDQGGEIEQLAALMEKLAAAAARNKAASEAYKTKLAQLEARIKNLE